MNRRGTIFSYSVIRSGPADFQGRTPYLLAIVEGEDQKLRMAQVNGYRDGAEISIGEGVDYVAEDAKGNPVYQLID